MAQSPAWRLPFLLLGVISLGTGLLTGIARLGVAMPAFFLDAAALHSAFMISGFFGTLISLERAVASHRAWPYLAPLLSGLGGVALLTANYAAYAPVLFVAAGVVFVAANLAVVLRQPALFTSTLLISATLWLVGNVFWLSHGTFWASAPYGLSFLILTIAGERLELTRFLPPRKYARELFLGLVLTIVAGTALAGRHGFEESTMLGIAYGLLALWLAGFDIARKTIRKSGITRFVAVCLLSGYLWLLIGGLLLATMPFDANPFLRDAGIHAIALGFVFSMVIGHAPIIFPAVMRVNIPFSPLFYLPLALIHLSVTIRLSAVLFAEPGLRTLGGEANGFAVLSFFATLLYQVIHGTKHAAR